LDLYILLLAVMTKTLDQPKQLLSFALREPLFQQPARVERRDMPSLH
jgi:hypothetical protein